MGIILSAFTKHTCVGDGIGSRWLTHLELAHMVCAEDLQKGSKCRRDSGRAHDYDSDYSLLQQNATS